MEIGNFQFASIPKIMFGPGEFNKSTKVINSYGNKMLLVLGAGSFKKSSYYSSFIEECKKSGIKIFEVLVKGEPSPGLVDQSVDEHRLNNIDVVVAIGGGSVLDAGKAISAMLKIDDSIENYLEGVGDKIHPGIKVPLIAVPTTSGTGSEATKNAVITKIGFYKKSLRHDNFVPDVAIVDPELTISCPKNVTAACGLDAFTQLLGAYLSTNSSFMTDALALDGIQAISDGLIQSYENPSDIKARTNLSYASMLSGIVLANAGLGLVHGFASPVGAIVDIPHGVVCGTLLGEVIEKNIIALEKMDDSGAVYLDKYTNVAKILSKGMNLPLLGILEYLVTTVKNWINIMKVNKLSDYGIKEQDLLDIVKKSSVKNNPVNFTDDELLEILRNRL